MRLARRATTVNLVLLVALVATLTFATPTVASGTVRASAAVGIGTACPAGLGPVPPFPDRPFGEAGVAVDCIADAGYGITLGDAQGRYNPGNNVQRDQMASFLVRLAGKSGITVPSSAPNAFDDDTGDTHEGNIDRLSALGIASGTGPRQYSPDRIVRRDQMATFLVKLMELGAGAALPTGGASFPDLDPTSPHTTNILKLADAGIVQGRDGLYRPADAVSRQSMALFIARVLELQVQAGRTAAAAPSSSYAFAFVGPDGNPTRFNPCAVVPYVVNPDGAPPGGIDDLHGAFARISDALGISFVYEGTTDERPSMARPPVQSRYGDRWAPILVGWVGPEENAQLVGPTAGIGEAFFVSTNGQSWVSVTGQVFLDRDELQAWPTGFGAGQTHGELVLHELGHVVGLNHVNDVDQRMHPVMTPGIGELGRGDRGGLWRLGAAQGCLTVPAPFLPNL